MTHSSDFVPWATGVGANTMSAAALAAALIRIQGAQIGIADPVTFNTILRQTSSMAAMIAKFMADYGPGDVIDNGDIANLEAQFIAALTQLISDLVTPGTGDGLYHWGGTDSGTADNYVLAAPTPSIAALTVGTTVSFKPANNNTGTTIINVAGVDKFIVRTDGSALQAGDLNSAGVAIIVYNGTQWVLTAVLQTVAGVPVATTTSNGIARAATDAEMAAGANSGSYPSFVRPEGLPMFAEGKWTRVTRTSNGTETAYNEVIILQGSSNFTTTLKTPSSVVKGYIIGNYSSVNQNINPGGGSFQGWSDFISAGNDYLLIPPGAIVTLKSDEVNWIVQDEYFNATTGNRGVVRLANDTEGTNGVTTGSSPAVMSPERVALFFAAHIATTSARGIGRVANLSEAAAGVTSGSSPAFLTPEAVANINPFLTTGRGAAITLYYELSTSYQDPMTMVGLSGTWHYQGGTATHAITLGAPLTTFSMIDARWFSTTPPAGTWMVWTASEFYTGGGSPVARGSITFVRVS